MIECLKIWDFALCRIYRIESDGRLFDNMLTGFVGSASCFMLRQCCLQKSDPGLMSWYNECVWVVILGHENERLVVENARSMLNYRSDLELCKY